MTSSRSPSPTQERIETKPQPLEIKSVVARHIVVNSEEEKIRCVYELQIRVCAKTNRTTRFTHADWIKLKLKLKLKNRVESVSSLKYNGTKSCNRRLCRTILFVVCGVSAISLCYLNAELFGQYFDYAVEQFPHFWFGIILICAFVVIIVDITRKVILPSKTLLEFHESQAPQIKDELKRMIAKNSGCDNETIAEFLEISNHSLGGNPQIYSPIIHKEGYVMFKQFSKRIYKKNRRSGVRLDCGIARCSFELGCRKRWHKRWAVLTNSSVALFKRLNDDKPTDVMLFDASFHCLRRDQGDNVVIVSGSNWVMEMKLKSEDESKRWHRTLTHVATHLGEWTRDHRFGSYAPVRRARSKRNVVSKESFRRMSYARWILNGSSYYRSVVQALRAAEKEVFITGWFLSPEVQLLRKASGDDEDLTLVDLVREIASNGVKVYVVFER